MASSARRVGRIVANFVGGFLFLGGNFRLRSRSLFHDYRWAQQKAAEAEGKSVVEAVMMQLAVAADRGQVRVIEAQSRHVLKIGAVEIDGGSIGAMDDASAIVRSDDRRANSNRGVRSRLDMHAGAGDGCGSGVRNHRSGMASSCGRRNGCASALRGSKRRDRQSYERNDGKPTDDRTFSHGSHFIPCQLYVQGCARLAIGFKRRTQPRLPDSRWRFSLAGGYAINVPPWNMP